MEHIVQTLIVIHLALLNIVIGGIQMRELYDGVLKPVSLSNDWAGLIGLNRNEMNLSWWIIFILSLHLLYLLFDEFLIICFLISIHVLNIFLLICIQLIYCMYKCIRTYSVLEYNFRISLP